jgi:hypothetical protein
MVDALGDTGHSRFNPTDGAATEQLQRQLRGIGAEVMMSNNGRSLSLLLSMAHLLKQLG